MKWNVDTYQLVVDNKNEAMYDILRDYSLHIVSFPLRHSNANVIQN